MAYKDATSASKDQLDSPACTVKFSSVQLHMCLYNLFVLLFLQTLSRTVSKVTAFKLQNPDSLNNAEVPSNYAYFRPDPRFARSVTSLICKKDQTVEEHKISSDNHFIANVLGQRVQTEGSIGCCPEELDGVPYGPGKICCNGKIKKEIYNTFCCEADGKVHDDTEMNRETCNKLEASSSAINIADDYESSPSTLENEFTDAQTVDEEVDDTSDMETGGDDSSNNDPETSTSNKKKSKKNKKQLSKLNENKKEPTSVVEELEKEPTSVVEELEKEPISTDFLNFDPSGSSEESGVIDENSHDKSHDTGDSNQDMAEPQDGYNSYSNEDQDDMTDYDHQDYNTYNYGSSSDSISEEYKPYNSYTYEGAGASSLFTDDPVHDNYDSYTGEINNFSNENGDSSESADDAASLNPFIHEDIIEEVTTSKPKWETVKPSIAPLLSRCVVPGEKTTGHSIPMAMKPTCVNATEGDFCEFRCPEATSIVEADGMGLTCTSDGAWEGNIPQCCMTTGCPSDLRIDFYFIIDCSSSIGEVNFGYVKDYINQLVTSLPIGQDRVRIGLLTYNSKIDEVFSLNKLDTKEEYLEAVQNIKYQGRGTYTGTAIHYAATKGLTLDHGDRPSVPNFIILLTDGRARDKKNAFNVKNSSPLLHAKGTIVAIGVGEKVRVKELKTIAGESGQVFMVQDFRSLGSNRLRLTGQNLCPKRCLRPGDEGIYYEPGNYGDQGLSWN